MSTEEPPSASDEILRFYDDRGYRYRVGPGTRPAIIVIDFSNAFTRGSSDFPGGNFSVEIQHTRTLLKAARAGHTPIVYTTIAYPDPARDAGLWSVKVPWLAHCRLGDPAVEIDPVLERRSDEAVIVKRFPSAFFATDLHARLAALGIDTIILAGCTTSVCVRATAIDAMQHGYRTLVAAEAVGDFNAALHAVHLRDIDARYGDVASLTEVLGYLKSLSQPR